MYLTILAGLSRELGQIALATKEHVHLIFDETPLSSKDITKTGFHCLFDLEEAQYLELTCIHK